MPFQNEKIIEASEFGWGKISNRISKYQFAFDGIWMHKLIFDYYVNLINGFIFHCAGGMCFTQSESKQVFLYCPDYWVNPY